MLSIKWLSIRRSRSTAVKKWLTSLSPRFVPVSQCSIQRWTDEHFRVHTHAQRAIRTFRDSASLAQMSR
jgi:hypothetical protein